MHIRPPVQPKSPAHIFNNHTHSFVLSNCSGLIPHLQFRITSTLLPVTDHYKFPAHLLNTSTVPQPVRQPVIPWCFSPPHANQPPWYLLHLGLFHKLISSRLHHRSVSHSQHTLDCIPNPPTGVIKDVCNSNSSIPYLLLASIREITIQSPPCACPVSNNLLKYRI